ncbi:MAG: hypothetical protein ACYS9X_02065 [Planctomycetota bacterium]|jgi:hypothetical protein
MYLAPTNPLGYSESELRRPGPRFAIPVAVSYGKVRPNETTLSEVCFQIGVLREFPDTDRMLLFGIGPSILEAYPSGLDGDGFVDVAGSVRLGYWDWGSWFSLGFELRYTFASDFNLPGGTRDVDGFGIYLVLVPSVLYAM